MHKGLIIFFILGWSKANAQDIAVNKLRSETARQVKKEADTVKWNWKRGGLVSANLSQGSLSNWAAGGDNFSMSVSSYFNYFFYYLKGRNSWDNNIDVNLGFVQSTSQGTRKNDDRFDYLSKYGYKIDTSKSAKWYASALFNLRSQLFDGYTYSNTDPDFASTIFSPAYFILSAGFDYKSSSKVSAFFSPLTARFTVVTNNYLSNKASYGVDTGKHVKSELGAYITLNYNNIITGDITYKGRLDLFSNYLDKPQNVDVYMTNLVSFKINRYFSATYSLDLIYDDNVRLFGPANSSPSLQVKSLIGIGFLMPLKPIIIKKD
jgi:hypothetical protein